MLLPNCFPGCPVRLTKANVDRLKLPQGKNETIAFDEALPGFGLRIRDGGKRTWIAQYRVGAKQRRVTLGTPRTLTPTRRERGEGRAGKSTPRDHADRKSGEARPGRSDARRRC